MRGPCANPPPQRPLKTLTVFHPSQEYLDDVQSLIAYIESEINVREVVLTSEEHKIGVGYRATADWPTLGKKLRKDMIRVKNGLPKLTSAEVKAYVHSGHVVVDGITLGPGDLQVSRFVELEADGGHDTATDNDVVVILDVRIHAELEGEGMAREVINRVQRLRKSAGLQPTDDVHVYYRFEEGEGELLVAAMKEYEDMISKAVRNVPVDEAQRPAGVKVFCEEEQQIGDTFFVLSFVRA